MSDLFAKTTMRGSQGLTPVALAIYYPKLQCGMEVDEVKSAGSVARDPAGTKNREMRKENRKDTEQKNSRTGNRGTRNNRTRNAESRRLKALGYTETHNVVLRIAIASL
jgi:hypothetical protein